MQTSIWFRSGLVLLLFAGLITAYQNCSRGFAVRDSSSLINASSALGSAGDLGGSTPASPNGTSPAGTIPIHPVAFNTTANRYDNLPSASAVAVGTKIVITLAPNGTWPSATFTPSSNKGTFSPATISVAAGSKAPATIEYTPTQAGEHYIQFTNSAQMHNPYPVPLNVFAPSNGSARAISAYLGKSAPEGGSFSDLHVFQRDAFAGNAAGFSLGSRGWGEVWIYISSLDGPTTALWAKPYDALSSGASAAVGTGTALAAAPAQVYGEINQPGTLRLLLPAQDAVVYWDIATDQAMSHPVRIAQRFSVADKIAAMTRSQKTGWGRGYPLNGPNPTGIHYMKTSVALMSDYRFAPGTDTQWSRQDGADADPAGSRGPEPNPTGSRWYDESTTAVAMEAGRLFSALLGVNLGIVADCYLGGEMNEFIEHDGTSNLIQLIRATDSKVRYVTINMTGWNGSIDSVNYPNETKAENKTRYAAFVDKLTTAFPSIAVIGGNTGDTGIFGTDGSRELGFTRNQMIWRDLAAQNPIVVSLEDYHWNGFYNNHALQVSRTQFARQDVRYLLSRTNALAGGLQTSNTGPTLAASGTMRAGTDTIKIAYNINGGGSLHSYQIHENADGITFTYSKDTASATDLASLFAVYPDGGKSKAPGALGEPIHIKGVTYDDAYVYIQLVSTQSQKLTVHYAADFGESGGTGLQECRLGTPGLVTILGDNLDPLAIGIGQSMFAQLDIAISVQ